MRLMKVTLKMAFHDMACEDEAKDHINERLWDFAVDNLDAEMVRITVDEQVIDIPDPDYDELGMGDEPDPFEAWQQKAEPYLEKL